MCRCATWILHIKDADVAPWHYIMIDDLELEREPESKFALHLCSEPIIEAYPYVYDVLEILHKFVSRISHCLMIDYLKMISTFK